MEDTLRSSEVLREAVESRAADASPSGVAMTLADVLARLETSAVSTRVQRDLRWAINRFCDGVGLAPIDISADPRAIRAQIERFSPAMLGLEPGTFDNIKSGLRRAMRLSGNSVRPRARNVPLGESWACLHALVDRGAKAKLGAFFTFCSEQGYLPEEISDAHLARFAQMLEEASINPKWLEIVKNTVREWNQASENIAGWPQARLTASGGRAEPVSLPWKQLPLAFQHDAEHYLAYVANPPLDDDFAPAKPLRATTLARRRFDLRHMASVLLRRGLSPDDLQSVADLLRPAALETIFSFFHPRIDGAGKTRYFQIAVVLKVIAKYWAKSGSSTMARIQREIRRHGKKRRGMVRKNRNLLAVFKDDQVAARLVTLPPRLFAALEKLDKLKRREAELALAALYIELSLMWPLRVGNMSSIHLQNNILRSGTGPSARVFLRFEADEVKNDIDLEAELPPSAIRLLDLFIKKYRPLLVCQQSLYLFPARNGGPRSRQTLWATITKVTERYVGVAVSPHQFRHVGADLYLRARPGEYEVVRRFLGHRSIDTTTTSYAGAETDAAIRLYDKNILRLREEAPAVLARRRRRKGARPSSDVGGQKEMHQKQEQPIPRREADDHVDEI